MRNHFVLDAVLFIIVCLFVGYTWTHPRGERILPMASEPAWSDTAVEWEGGSATIVSYLDPVWGIQKHLTNINMITD